jgi:hypothetical protein
MASAALLDESVEKDDRQLAEAPEKMTVLEALARHVARTGPNMSNQTTEPRNTDIDDQ